MQRLKGRRVVSLRRLLGFWVLPGLLVLSHGAPMHGHSARLWHSLPCICKRASQPTPCCGAAQWQPVMSFTRLRERRVGH